MILGCTSYTINRELNKAVTISIDFVLKVHPSNTDEIAATLEKLENLLGGGNVDIVRNNERPALPEKKG